MSFIYYYCPSDTEIIAIFWVSLDHMLWTTLRAFQNLVLFNPPDNLELVGIVVSIYQMKKLRFREAE